MANPAITVAMSVYNGEPYLAEAIDSVLAQSFADFEFLILDDGSTDGSCETIQRYADRDPRVRPIIRENRGLIASLNQLLAEARAPLIARMDADDICRPQRFERQIAFLAQHPDHGVVGSWSEDIDARSRSIQGEAFGADQPTTYDAFLAAIDAYAPLLCHPAVMYRTEVVRAVGGYHAAFRHCEDLDLWLRLATRTRICSIPERLLRYRRSDGQISRRFSIDQTIGGSRSRCSVGSARPGLSERVRAQVVRDLLYSHQALRGAGLDLVLDHIARGGPREGLWRTVLRLLKFGEPRQAARLARALAA